MFQVMIVDDEVLVRVGIKSLIAWERHGFRCAADAADGVSALAAIRRREPDILLTDIVMPNMDGLELIRRVKAEHPAVRIIVLSSHHDYPYLRDALRAGADDYLLKGSLKPDELLACLQEVSRRILERRDMREHPETRTSKEERLLAWLHADGADDADDADADGTDGAQAPFAQEEGAAHRLFLVRPLRAPAPGTPGDCGNDAPLASLIEQFMRNWTQAVDVARVRPGELAVVARRRDGLSEGDVRQMGRDIIVASRRFLSINCAVGISSDFAEPKALKRAYGEAAAALEQAYYEGVDEPQIGRPPQGEAVPDAGDFFPKDRMDQLMQSLAACDADQAMQEVDLLFDRLDRLRPPLVRCHELQLELFTCLQMQWKETGLPLARWIDRDEPAYGQILGFSGLADARSWFHALTETFCREVKAYKQQRYSKEILQLTEYILRHYTEPLSLKEAAGYVNLSEGHLGYLFKKETGKSFVTYITDLRMQKALDYLNNSDLPVYAIAERLGYANINYFGRLFKKKIGVSPAQYREK